jgi:hypothetical protein
MNSILWVCDKEGGDSDNTAHQIALELERDSPLEYAHEFVYYESNPPVVIEARIEEADLVVCSDREAVRWIQSCDSGKPIVLRYCTDQPAHVLARVVSERLRDRTSTAKLRGQNVGGRNEPRSASPPIPQGATNADMQSVERDRGKAHLPERGKPTPETDTSLIYQTAASEFYNIPKSLLSKAAKKKPRDFSYLWSDTDGRRRWYRKSDLQRMAQSREKLRGT